MFLQLTYWFIINVNNQNIYDVAPRLVSVPNMKQIISYAYSMHNQKSELICNLLLCNPSLFGSVSIWFLSSPAATVLPGLLSSLDSSFSYTIEHFIVCDVIKV